MGVGFHPFVSKRMQIAKTFAGSAVRSPKLLIRNQELAAAVTLRTRGNWSARPGTWRREEERKENSTSTSPLFDCVQLCVPHSSEKSESSFLFFYLFLIFCIFSIRSAPFCSFLSRLSLSRSLLLFPSFLCAAQLPIQPTGQQPSVSPDPPFYPSSLFISCFSSIYWCLSFSSFFPLHGRTEGEKTKLGPEGCRV